jgi:hypothetical protein
MKLFHPFLTRVSLVFEVMVDGTADLTQTFTIFDVPGCDSDWGLDRSVFSDTLVSKILSDTFEHFFGGHVKPLVEF